MVMTVLEAHVRSESWGALKQAFGTTEARLPAQLLESVLVQDRNDKARWRVITIGRSQEDLQEYRRSVETSEGVLMLRAVRPPKAVALSASGLIHLATRGRGVRRVLKASE